MGQFDSLMIDDNSPLSPFNYAKRFTSTPDIDMENMGDAYIKDIYKPSLKQAGVDAGQIDMMAEEVKKRFKDSGSVENFIASANPPAPVDEQPAVPEKSSNTLYNFGGGVAQGIGGSVASVIQGVPELVNTVADMAVPDDLTTIGMDRFLKPEENVVLEGARDTANWVREASTISGVDQTSIATTIGSGIGSALGTVAVGGVLGVMGKSAGAISLGMTAQSAAQLAGEGAHNYDQSVKENGNENDRNHTILLNSFLAAFDSIHAGTFLKGAASGFEPLIADSAKKAMLKGASSEAITEMAQTIGQNLIASDLVSYDKSQGTFEGVAEAGTGGAAAGAFMTGLIRMIAKGRSGEINPSTGEATQTDPLDPTVSPLIDEANKEEERAIAEEMAIKAVSHKDILTIDNTIAVLNDTSVKQQKKLDILDRLALTNPQFSPEGVDWADPTSVDDYIARSSTLISESRKNIANDLQSRAGSVQVEEIPENIRTEFDAAEGAYGLPKGTLSAYSKITTHVSNDAENGLLNLNQLKDAKALSVQGQINEAAKLAINYSAVLNDSGVDVTPYSVVMSLEHGVGNFLEIQSAANKGDLPVGSQTQQMMNNNSGIDGIKPSEYIKLWKDQLNDSNEYTVDVVPSKSAHDNKILDYHKKNVGDKTSADSLTTNNVLGNVMTERNNNYNKQLEGEKARLASVLNNIAEAKRTKEDADLSKLTDLAAFINGETTDHSITSNNKFTAALAERKKLGEAYQRAIENNQPEIATQIATTADSVTKSLNGMIDDHVDKNMPAAKEIVGSVHIPSIERVPGQSRTDTLINNLETTIAKTKEKEVAAAAKEAARLETAAKAETDRVAKEAAKVEAERKLADVTNAAKYLQSGGKEGELGGFEKVYSSEEYQSLDAKEKAAIEKIQEVIKVQSSNQADSKALVGVLKELENEVNKARRDRANAFNQYAKDQGYTNKAPLVTPPDKFTATDEKTDDAIAKADKWLSANRLKAVSEAVTKAAEQVNVMNEEAAAAAKAQAEEEAKIKAHSQEVIDGLNNWIPANLNIESFLPADQAAVQGVAKRAELGDVTTATNEIVEAEIAPASTIIARVNEAVDLSNKAEALMQSGKLTPEQMASFRKQYAIVVEEANVAAAKRTEGKVDDSYNELVSIVNSLAPPTPAPTPNIATTINEAYTAEQQAKDKQAQADIEAKNLEAVAEYERNRASIISNIARGYEVTPELSKVDKALLLKFIRDTDANIADLAARDAAGTNPLAQPETTSLILENLNPRLVEIATLDKNQVKKLGTELLNEYGSSDVQDVYAFGLIRIMASGQFHDYMDAIEKADQQIAVAELMLTSPDNTPEVTAKLNKTIDENRASKSANRQALGARYVDAINKAKEDKKSAEVQPPTPPSIISPETVSSGKKVDTAAVKVVVKAIKEINAEDKALIQFITDNKQSLLDKKVVATDKILDNIIKNLGNGTQEKTKISYEKLLEAYNQSKSSGATTPAATSPAQPPAKAQTKSQAKPDNNVDTKATTIDDTNPFDTPAKEVATAQSDTVATTPATTTTATVEATNPVQEVAPETVEAPITPPAEEVKNSQLTEPQMVAAFIRMELENLYANDEERKSFVDIANAIDSGNATNVSHIKGEDGYNASYAFAYDIYKAILTSAVKAKALPNTEQSEPIDNLETTTPTMESKQNAEENTVAITGENDTKAIGGVKGKTRQAPKRGAKKQPAKTEDNPGVSESDSKEVAQYVLPVEMPVEQAKEVLADVIAEIKTGDPSLSEDAALSRAASGQWGVHRNTDRVAEILTRLAGEKEKDKDVPPTKEDISELAKKYKIPVKLVTDEQADKIKKAHNIDVLRGFVFVSKDGKLSINLYLPDIANFEMAERIILEEYAHAKMAAADGDVKDRTQLSSELTSIGKTLSASKGNRKVTYDMLRALGFEAIGIGDVDNDMKQIADMVEKEMSPEDIGNEVVAKLWARLKSDGASGIVGGRDNKELRKRLEEGVIGKLIGQSFIQNKKTYQVAKAVSSVSHRVIPDDSTESSPSTAGNDGRFYFNADYNILNRAIDDANAMNGLLTTIKRTASNSAGSVKNARSIANRLNPSVTPRNGYDKRSWFKKNVSSTHGLPDGFKDGKYSRHLDIVMAEDLKRAGYAKVNFEIHSDILELDATLQALFKKQSDKITDSEKELFNEALQGNYRFSDPAKQALVNLHRIKLDKSSVRLTQRIRSEIEARVNALPVRSRAEVGKAIIAMTRGLSLSGFSKEAKDIATRSLHLDKINKNMSLYIHRSYKAFYDPQWVNKVKGTRAYIEAVKYMANANGKTWEKQLAAKGYRLDARKLDELAQAEVMRLLTDAQKSASPMQFMLGGALRHSILRQKGDIPVQIREVLGEIKDPVFNYANTKKQIETYIVGHEYSERLRDIGLATGMISPSPTTEHTEQFVDSEKYPMLQGHYISRQNLEALSEFGALPPINDGLLGGIIKINSYIKYGKTVMSPTTISRNIMSGYFLMMASGHPAALGDIPAAFSALTKGSTSKSIMTGKITLADEVAKENALEWLSMGIIHDGAHQGEIEGILKDAISMDVNDIATPSKFQEFLRKLNRVYGFGDDLWKIAAYEAEKADLVKNGVVYDEAKYMAAKRIRDLMPTYSKVPDMIKMIRRVPLFGTFVSFPWEVIRNLKNSFKYAREDYLADRKGMAAKRISGVAMAYAMPSALIAPMLASMFDIDDEDRDLIEKVTPSYENGMLRLFTGNEDGKLSWIDGASIIPSESIIAGFRIALQSGEDAGVVEAIGAGAGRILKPFIGVDMTLSSVFNLINNNDPATGRSIYGQGLKFEDVIYSPYEQKEAFADMVAYLGKTLGAGFINNVVDFYKANASEPKDEKTVIEEFFGSANQLSSSGREFTNKDAVKAMLGFRSRTFSVDQLIDNSIKGIRKEVDDVSARLKNSADRFASMSDADLADLVDNTYQSRKEAFDKAFTIIDYLRSSGKTDREIMAVLYDPKDGTLTKGDSESLMKGKYPNYKATETLVKRTVKAINSNIGNKPDPNWIANQRAINERFSKLENLFLQYEESKQ